MEVSPVMAESALAARDPRTSADKKLDVTAKAVAAPTPETDAAAEAHVRVSLDVRSLRVSSQTEQAMAKADASADVMLWVADRLTTTRTLKSTVSTKNLSASDAAKLPEIRDALLRAPLPLGVRGARGAYSRLDSGSPNLYLRLGAILLTESRSFELVSLATISVNCVIMALDHPVAPGYPPHADFFEECDRVFLVLYTAEMVPLPCRAAAPSCHPADCSHATSDA